MLLLEDRRFYVYVFLDPTKPGIYRYGEYMFNYCPFYIGKGRGRRMYKHLQPGCLNKYTFKNNVIKKIISSGYRPIIVKIIENLTNKEAFKHEINLISKIGRRDKKLGPLANLTNGGEGMLGFIPGQKTRRKIGEFRKGRKFLGRPCPEERKRKIGEALRGKSTKGGRPKGIPFSEEHKRKISKAKNGCSNSHLTKPVSINNVYYNSIREAGRILNMCDTTIGRRTKNKNIPNYKYTSAV